MQVDDQKLVSEAESPASPEIHESCQPAKGRGRGQLVRGQKVAGVGDGSALQAAAVSCGHASKPGFSGPPPPPPGAFQPARASWPPADSTFSGIPSRPIGSLQHISAPYPPVINRCIGGLRPPVGWRVPQESEAFWESKGRYRMICVCRWQTSIDCKFWEKSSFPDGVRSRGDALQRMAIS